MQPNIKFPLLDDGKLTTEEVVPIYEFANYMWNNSVFDNALSKLLEKYPRHSLDSLLYGQEYTQDQTTQTSGILEDTGIAVIRAPGSFYLLIKYSGFTNGHAHNDVGSIVLYKVLLQSHMSYRVE